MTAFTVVLAVVAGGLVGAVIGSFAGVVRSRGWRGALSGRSRCDGCRRRLRWYELIPLVSFAIQGGRCRTCGSAIGRETLLVEVVGAGLGILAALAVVAVSSR
ncbi:MAG TPA: prepilin peptidase [Candidatus Binatia bacterium]|nr:prepilin peptidase [Candidatus Binatia bacterium]